MKHLLLPALALLLLTQCKKADPDPASQLPPATQTGANTFGCLLNGQPWTPSGNYGPSNYRLVYDPTYVSGDLEIRVYRYVPAINNSQYFFISAAPINKVGIYPIDNRICGVYYSTGIKGACYEYDQAPGLTINGQLIITKLDLVHGIISGKLDFKLWQPGCDTLRFTQGRFDYKL